jgi:hypothetical protein
MRKPALWRYYGFNILVLVVVIVMFSLGLMKKANLSNRFLDLVDNIGFSVLGFSLLLVGADYLMLWRQYPAFLKENAPKWDSRAHNVSSISLLFLGIWCSLIGAVFAYFGSRSFIEAILTANIR